MSEWHWVGGIIFKDGMPLRDPEHIEQPRELIATRAFLEMGASHGDEACIVALAEIAALSTAIEAIERDVSMGINLMRHAGTDPEAWFDTALQSARAALARASCGSRASEQET